jgi:hypothetical protein
MSLLFFPSLNLIVATLSEQYISLRCRTFNSVSFQNISDLNLYPCSFGKVLLDNILFIMLMPIYEMAAKFQSFDSSADTLLNLTTPSSFVAVCGGAVQKCLQKETNRIGIRVTFIYNDIF